ncbi:preprotein translocase subunit SecE [Acaryochloris sp. IP29b_bin.137]|uniref:preprotein translocase subunit SecE n=1 Tax=Acaryochloris sp. IP29b_bin.137 TaxID=2969217 RepID=UPI002622426C|nr:preprotein translocase subunit SecE [Acaryochloris sp. IP29b_bin.137]
MSSTTAAVGEGASESDSVAAEPAAIAPPGPNSTGFLQGTKEELEKVVWPDRQQLISESIAVFLMVSLSAFIFSFIDNLFRWVSTLVFG